MRARRTTRMWWNKTSKPFYNFILTCGFYHIYVVPGNNSPENNCLDADQKNGMYEPSPKFG